MAEEVTQTTSTEQPSSTEAPQTTEPTLEEVYQSFKVEETPAPQTAPVVQPAQAPVVPQVHIPDPALDPDGFRAYERQRVQDQHSLRTALQGIAGQLTAFQRAQAMQKEEQDIKKAVGALKEKNPDLDDDFLEVALGAKARKDPKLMSLWNSRGKNPQAWDAAVKAYSNEIAGKFTMKADPQLAENQRAMKTAQQTMATAQKESSADERLGKLQGAEFDRAMDRIRQGYSPF